MSFDINWSLLQDGVEADKLKTFLNSKFESVTRPNFLGPVQVSQLDFGTIPPEIAVTNISDPLEEFYFDDDNETPNSCSSFENTGSYFDESTTIPRKNTDIQVEISMMYKGDLKMSITTELIVNQPTPGFMILPLQLTITKTSLKGKKQLMYQLQQ